MTQLRRIFWSVRFRFIFFKLIIIHLGVCNFSNCKSNLSVFCGYKLDQDKLLIAEK